MKEIAVDGLIARAKEAGLKVTLVMSGQMVLHRSPSGYSALTKVEYRGSIYECDLYLRNRYRV